jgi:hypothetical protein
MVQSYLGVPKQNLCYLVFSKEHLSETRDDLIYIVSHVLLINQFGTAKTVFELTRNCLGLVLFCILMLYLSFEHTYLLFLYIVITNKKLLLENQKQQ